MLYYSSEVIFEKKTDTVNLLCYDPELHVYKVERKEKRTRARWGHEVAARAEKGWRNRGQRQENAREKEERESRNAHYDNYMLCCCMARMCLWSSASVHLARIGHSTPSFNWYGTERLIRKHLASRGIPTYMYPSF